MGDRDQEFRALFEARIRELEERCARAQGRSRELSDDLANQTRTLTALIEVCADAEGACPVSLPSPRPAVPDAGTTESDRAAASAPPEPAAAADPASEADRRLEAERRARARRREQELRMALYRTAPGRPAWPTTVA